jgi:hypothetical protein
MKNYELIIDILTDLINEQNSTIKLMKWQIEDLKKQLETAEYHLDPTPEKAKKIEIR